MKPGSIPERPGYRTEMGFTELCLLRFSLSGEDSRGRAGEGTSYSVNGSFDFERKACNLENGIHQVMLNVDVGLPYISSSTRITVESNR